MVRSFRRLAIPLFALCSACPAGPDAEPAPQAPPAPPPVVQAAATPAAAVPDTRDDADIARAGQAFVDLLFDISPEMATRLGAHTRDRDLDDRTLAGFERDVGREEKMLADLGARFASPNASRAARTDLEILEHALAVDIRVKREERPLERQPDAYEAPLDALFVMTARNYAPAKDRANDVLARLEKLPDTMLLARTNLKNPPRVWTEIAIERAQGAKGFFDDIRPELLKALPGEQARVDHALGAARAAYASYGTFLKHDLLPRSTGSYAAGADLFGFILSRQFFLTESADDLAQLGQKILDQTNEQMNALAHKMDPAAKGWPDLTRRIKANHPKAEELREAYKKEVLRARAFLVAHDVVPFPPDDVCDVIDTPPFQRSTITAAYDEPPPFDAKETHGFFYVTPIDLTLSQAKQEEMLREDDHGDLVDTAVHETYPGHHLQLSFERLYPSVVRKVTATSLFEEGWGLYAEELMSELGYYTDEERMMQLEWTLVRAARIIIDVGLHTKGMTFDQAVAILTDKVHLERQLALSEVKRYTESPTQPLSYLVGREMIMKLRERYKEAQGERYSLKKFHEEVLSRGGIVPGLLAEEMFEK